MTGEERKALSFVALLLGLSVVARAMNRPEPLVVSGATAVEISARLQQNQQVRERISKPAQASGKTSQPPASPSSVPAWRRGSRPADIIQYRAGRTPVAGGQVVNVNRATVEELDQLPGVSPAVAQRILEYRAAHGPFQNVQQLDSVKGIGPALLKKLQPLIRFR